MSGFEVVGIVLGGLPLIIKVAKDYREGFEPILKWHHFRREFRVFINNVDLEYQLFACLTERLLEYTNLSSQDKEDLLVENNLERWCHPDVKDALIRRLGNSYAVCLQQLEAIHEDLLKLQSIMSLKDGSVDWAERGKDRGRWKYQRKRISHSFNGRGTATIASLGEKNRKLRDLLDELDKRASRQSRRTPTSKVTALAMIFEYIRKQAISVHLALERGWNCNCESPHLTALQLQQRFSDSWSSQFIMTSGPRQMGANIKHSYCKIQVTLSQNKADISATSGRPPPTPLPERYLDKLRRDFGSTAVSKLKVDKLPSTNPRSISAPVYVEVHQPATIPNMEQPAKRTTFASSTETMTERPRYSWRGQKYLKDKPSSIIQETDVAPHSPEPMKNNLEVPSSSLSNSIQSKEQIDPTINAIEDICSTLETLEADASCLGYILDNEHHQYQLRSLKDSTPPPCDRDLISLEKLLDTTTKLKLTRKQRFRLAVVLTSSLLQLQTTPWLPDRLDKTEIYFESDGQTILSDQPYLYHFFPSTKMGPPSPSVTESKPSTTGFAARISLTNLGILLLELCFGQSIEATTHWNNILDMDGGRQHRQTGFETALEWKSEVEEEAGSDFKDAIDRCFSVDVKPNWADMRFTQSIYAGVLQPLEKAVDELGWAVNRDEE